MTAVLIAVLTMTVVGIPVTLALDRGARGPLLVGLAFLYGSAATWAALFLMSILHIKWTPVTAMAVLMLIAIATAIAAKRSTQDSGLRTQDSSDSPLGTRHSALHPLDALTLILLAGYTAYITVASLWEWDFWAIWGLKARVFLERGGIDWVWLENPWNEFAHPDYPLLVPLNYDFVALLSGGWSDRWLGVLFVAWAVAILLVVRALTADEAPNWISAAATAAVTIVAMSRFAGMAEAALIAYAGAALLFLRRAVRDDRPLDWRHGAILLGLAANCKNEGIALLVATAIGIAVAAPRRLLRLWPAGALIAPWMLLRAAHALPTDIASGSLLGRFFDRLGHAGDVAAILWHALVDPWSWLILIVTFVIVPKALRRERFLVVVTAVQLLFYVATYFVTPHDLKWHVMTSWSRLTQQVQLPITVACVLLLAQLLVRGEDAPHAEARQQQ
jgi:hypothetical protein